MGTFVSTGCCGYGSTSTPAGGGGSGGGGGDTVTIVSMVHLPGKIVTLLSDGTTVQCAYNSDVVIEGATNKYFTDLRKQAILDAIAAEAITRSTADIALQTQISDRQLLSEKGQPNGYASLDANGKHTAAESRGSTLQLNPLTYEITLTGADGQSTVIDLPIETLFQTAAYNPTTKKLVLTTADGNEITIDLADLVDLPEIQLSSGNPGTPPSTGQKVYFNYTTGSYWLNVAGSWVGAFLSVTTAEKTAWNAKADAANTYTKTEVDAKVASVYRIKGSVATVAALPTTGNTLGDVYNVTATGQNYVWIGGTDGDLGNGWDSLGGTVDLTNYYTKTESLDKFEPKIVVKNDAFNKSFGVGANEVARGNHTHNLSNLNNDVNFQTHDDVDSAVREAIADLKAGVSTEGNTLKKLFDLIVSSLTEIKVGNIPERDNLNITKLPTNVFVIDDGDGRWALYKATSTGINASFVKISDPDLLNAVMSASQIKSAYESNPNTNAFSNVYKNRLEYIATLAEADQVQNSGQDRTYNVNGRELLIGNALLLTLQTILGTGLKLKNNGEVEVLSTNQLAAKFKRGNGVRLYNTDGKELTLHNEAATQDISIKVPDEGGSRFMATREWVELTKYAYENIADGEDLNDYKTSGLFNLNRDYSYYGHTPTQGDAFVFALLRITKIDGGAVQEIIGLDTANDRLNTFKRFYNKENDYWTEWQKTITSNEVSDTQMYNWTIAYNAMTSLQNGVAKYTKTTGSTYNVLPTDYIIAVLANTTTTINLPSTSDVPNGKVYEFCSYGDFSGTSYIGGAGAQLYAASGDKFHHPINNSSKTSFQFKNTLDSNSNNALSLKIMKDGNSWIVLQTSSFDY